MLLSDWSYVPVYPPDLVFRQVGLLDLRQSDNKGGYGLELRLRPGGQREKVETNKAWVWTKDTSGHAWQSRDLQSLRPGQTHSIRFAVTCGLHFAGAATDVYFIFLFQLPKSPFSHLLELQLSVRHFSDLLYLLWAEPLLREQLNSVAEVTCFGLLNY